MEYTGLSGTGPEWPEVDWKRQEQAGRYNFKTQGNLGIEGFLET